MKKLAIDKSMKFIILAGFGISWLAFYTDCLTGKRNFSSLDLTASILLIWLYQQFYFILQKALQTAEGQLYNYLLEENLINTDFTNQLMWDKVKEKISFESKVSKPYLDNVLQSLGTGILYIDKNTSIQLSKAFSLQHCFAEFYEGISFVDFIYNDAIDANEKQRINFIFRVLFGMPKLQWDILSKNLPKKLNHKNKNSQIKSFNLHYVPHFNNDGLHLITVVIQDQSDVKKDQIFIKNQSSDMKKFFSILSIPDSVFELFMDETGRIFKDLKRMLKLINSEKLIDHEIIRNMLRLVHTLKANAGLFGFDSIQRESHSTEEELIKLQQKKINNIEGAIATINTQITKLSEEIYSYNTLKRDIFEFTHRKQVEVERYRVQWIKNILMQMNYHVSNRNFSKYDFLFKQCSRAISNLEKVSLKDYLKRYDNMVSQLAKEHGKKVETLEIDLGIHLFDKRILFHLNDIIVHALRNAVIHGIEPSEFRLKKGKNVYGKIRLRTLMRGDMICLSIEDDGAGIKTQAIKSRLLQSESSRSKDEPVTESELIDFLFKSNVSTREKTDLSAGRGIGLDIIKSYVQCLRGSVDLIQNKQGMKLEVSFPMDIEDILQPNNFYHVKNLLHENLISNFSAEKIHLSLHDKSLNDDVILGNKLILAEILRHISEFVIKQPFVWDQLFVDVFKLTGKRKIDFDNVYRILIGLTGENIGFDKQDIALGKAEYLARKLGGSMLYRGPSVLELNIPSGFKNGNSLHRFDIVALKKYKPSLTEGIKNFFAKQTNGWSHNVEWVNSLSEAVSSSVGRIIITNLEALESDQQKSFRKHDSFIILNIGEKEFELLSSFDIPADQIFFFDTDEASQLLTDVIASLLVKRFDKQLSSAIALEDYRLAS